MKKVLIVFFLVMTYAVASCYGDSVRAASPVLRQAKEYAIKAVYLYKFLLFVEWPEPKSSDSDEKPAPNPARNVVTIGIVGKDPFGVSFGEVEGKLIRSKNKRLVIKRFGSFRTRLDLSVCDLLFVCSSEKKRVGEILKKLNGKPILTVGDMEGFIETGGMINLVKVGNKVRWEINRGPAKKAGLKISSQLLRNALRVVEIPKVDKKDTLEGGGK